MASATIADVTEKLTENNKQAAATLKISVRALEQQQAQKKVNDESRAKLGELKATIESAGGVAEKNSEYNRLLLNQEKAENDLRQKSDNVSAKENAKTASALKISVTALKQRQAQKKAIDEGQTKLEELKISIESAGGVAEKNSEYNKLLLEQEKKQNDLIKANDDTTAEVPKKIAEARTEQEAMRKSLEEQGKIATDNKKYNKLAYNTTKEELKQRYKDATSPAAKAEIRAEQRANAKKQGSLLDKISTGIGGISDGIKNMGKKAAKGAGSLLKKSLFAGMYLALLAFINSKYWDKFIDIIAKAAEFVTEKLIPIVKFLWEKVLKPLGDAIKGGFLRAWENIKELFDDIGEAIALFKEGKILEGILALVTGIGTFFLKTIDNAITTIYNMFANLFGFEKEDSIGKNIIGFFKGIWQRVTDFFTVTIPEVLSKSIGWLTGIGARIGSFFKDIWSGVTNFFTETVPQLLSDAKNELFKIKDKILSIFTGLWDSVRNLFGNWNIFKFVDETFGELFTAIKKVFGGDFSLKNLTAIAKSLIDILYWPINAAINLVKDIFKWGDPDKPFKLSEFLFGPDGIISKVVTFFKDLLSIDFSKLLIGFIEKIPLVGGRIAKLFDGGDDETSETAEGTPETAKETIKTSEKAIKDATKEAKKASKEQNKEADLYTVDLSKIDKKRNEEARKKIKKLDKSIRRGGYRSTSRREDDETRLRMQQTTLAKRQGLAFSGGGEYGNFPDIKPPTSTKVDTMTQAKQAENAEKSAGAGTTVTSVNPTSISADKTTNHYSFDNKIVNPESVPTMLTSAL